MRVRGGERGGEGREGERVCKSVDASMYVRGCVRVRGGLWDG